MPASRSMPLLAWIAARPGRAFAAFLALHAAVWTALPTLLYPNLPLDLIEALVYGREWQLGYDKLPPLPWWLVEIAYLTVGHDFAYYLLAQIAVVAGFAFVTWRRGRWSARSARWSPCSSSTACTTSTTPPPSSITTSSSCRSGRWPALPSTARCAAGRRRIGCCSAWRSACRCGRNISSRCWRSRWRCSSSSTATRARRWRRPDPISRSPSRWSPWRRIWSGWCRTISCPSPMPSTARCRRAG